MRNCQSQKNEFENSCYANRSKYSVGLYYDLGKSTETNTQACIFHGTANCLILQKYSPYVHTGEKSNS